MVYKPTNITVGVSPCRYWCDIPVFHINGAFWAKHRLTAEDVEATGRLVSLVVGRVILVLGMTNNMGNGGSI